MGSIGGDGNRILKWPPLHLMAAKGGDLSSRPVLSDCNDRPIEMACRRLAAGNPSEPILCIVERFDCTGASVSLETRARCLKADLPTKSSQFSTP